MISAFGASASLLPGCLLAASAMAAASDLRTGRIPNALTYGLAVVALSLHALLAGPLDAALALLCMIAVLAACLPIFAFNWLRGGDIKMIVACAGVTSIHYLVPLLLYTMLAGGLVSLIVAWRFGSLRESFAAVGSAAHPLLHGILPTSLPFTTRKVPYGVAIFFGSILTALAMTLVPALRLL